ncbi:FAD dependent oxidoreductase [Aspergillus sclerotioniger CBS 115572]|uniref:FAD dependent oxidoreductase n=1 Tax=Aspergillus sclerotioniger CBS 115572 TaxID=1450535 RepID=A0A317V263_9EURO|nr:FAD dependent oxidoreductase [Aspergillus sclerotioniger CBS 115572]PWY67118.1 FAD dependent oxidoreductase [Aspergillus sclerotioniger CBS 115572]
MMPLLSISAYLPLFLGIVSGTSHSHATHDQARDVDVIRRDVCIIGGGAAGTYAAMSLRQLNQSVVVVEKTGRLGGHTITYIDPATGTPVDFGVTLFEDSPETVDFFTQFDVPVTKAMHHGDRIARIDFQTGEIVEPYPGNITDALERYGEILQQYPYLAAGWSLPDEVPEDLVMPFGQFVEKYDLGAAVELISIYSQGGRHWLNHPTVYMMKSVSLAMLDAFETGFLCTARHNNGEVFDAALDELGEDVLLHSVVVNASRSHDETHLLTVQSSDGEITIIEADATIVAVPPRRQVLAGLDVDETESQLFDQFLHGHYYAGLVRVDGYPKGLQIVNRGANTAYTLPSLPCTFGINPTAVADIVMVSYGSEKAMTEEDVKAAITEDLLGLNDAGYDLSDPELVAFADHSPFQMSVSSEAIEAGFHQDLNHLQGYRNTYYIGGTYEHPWSSAIWRGVDQLLPSIIEGALARKL